MPITRPTSVTITIAYHNINWIYVLFTGNSTTSSTTRDSALNLHEVAKNTSSHPTSRVINLSNNQRHKNLRDMPAKKLIPTKVPTRRIVRAWCRSRRITQSWNWRWLLHDNKRKRNVSISVIQEWGLSIRQWNLHLGLQWKNPCIRLLQSWTVNPLLWPEICHSKIKEQLDFYLFPSQCDFSISTYHVPKNLLHDPICQHDIATNRLTHWSCERKSKWW